MERTHLFPRLFMASAFALAIVLLGNHFALNMDFSPARSWDSPVVDDESATFQVTFQLDEGDRLTVDVEAVLWNMRTHVIEGYEAYLFHTPEGIPGPAVVLADADFSAAGEKKSVNTPTQKGEIFVPDTPTWTVEAEGWVTFVLVIEHGGRIPDGESARYWWGEALVDEFVETTAPAGRITYSTIPRAALAWQPVANVAVGLAVVGVLVGAGGALRNRGDEPGLAGNLHFAQKAKSWLVQLSDQLWLSAVGLLLLAFLLSLVLGMGDFALNHGRQPDAGYMTRTTMLLWFSFVALLAGFIVRVIQVRKHIRRIPSLELDE